VHQFIDTVFHNFNMMLSLTHRLDDDDWYGWNM
jgi:hypothetical protein